MADPYLDDGFDDGRAETPNQRRDRNWAEILQELRVVQTGTQLLSGFLLAVAFQPRFVELDPLQLGVYLGLVGIAALATLLGIAPVILHRLLFRRLAKEQVVIVGARLLTADLIVVGVLAIGVTALIFDFALSRTAGVVALAVGVLAVVALWAGLPRVGRRDGEA